MTTMAQRRLLIKSHPRREAPRTTFADPTRTGGLRRQFVAELRRQFSSLRADLLRWGRDSPATELSLDWFERQADQVLLSPPQERLWELLVDSAFRRGASRSFDDVVPRGESRDRQPFDRRSREGFLTALMSQGTPSEGLLTQNVFCPTGEGGGVDPTCSPNTIRMWGGSAKLEVVDKVDTGNDVFDHEAEISGRYIPERGVIQVASRIRPGVDESGIGWHSRTTSAVGRDAVIAHEMSHVVDGGYDKNISGTKEFEKLFLDGKTRMLDGERSHIVSRYSMVSQVECFAENAAIFRVAPSRLKTMWPEMHSFMEKNLPKDLTTNALFSGLRTAFGTVKALANGIPEFDRRSREGFLTALMSQGMQTDQVMTTNEGGVEIDCGANAPGGGGFQPGNTCARGEKSGKPGREQIIKDAADRIEVTDEIVKEDPIDDDDLDAIEERMTEEEINQMQEVMDAWKESYADSYEEDHNYDFDEDDVARGADWDDGEVHSRAMSAVDGLDIDDESKALAKTEIEAWYQDTRLHGEDAARELEKHLRNSGVHDEVLSEVRSIRDTAAEEIQAHRDTLVERERADRRERFIDQYDDSGDRREYLRDFYDRHSHEYRFSGGFKKEGSWGKDVDGDLTYGFTTSQGNKYEVWSFDKFKEGDVHVREFGFKDAEGSHGVTGAGGAHEVFKTVSSAMTAVISKKDLPAVYFSASEESRQRLYDRLVKTVAKVLPEYAAVAVPATDKTPKGYIVAKRSLIPTLREHAEKRGIGSKFEVLVNASRWIELEPDFQSEWIGLTDYVSNALLSRLRTAFDTVKALAKRAWDEFKGGVRGMVQGVQRAATDGVLQGKSPQKVAREAVKVVDRAFEQAKGLVQTEVTRAHAKGQLVGFVALGVKEVGVLVEWRVKRDANGQIASTVCPSCRAMEGVVLKISEADGLIPLHPRCMCAYSKPRENVKGQKRSKGDIDKAIAKARARRKAKPGQGWGAKVRIAQKRPTGNRDLIAEFSERIENVFCPTGPGGGVDPSCSPSAKIQKELDRVSSSFSSSPLTDAEDRMVYDWKTGNSNLLDKPEFIAAVEKGVVEKDVTVYRAGGLSSTKALEFTTRESWAKDTAEAQDRSVITIHLKKGDRALFVPLATRHHIVEVGVLLPPSTMRKYENVTNVFCPTGPGGGVDPTCSPSKSTKVVTIIKDMVRIQAERFKEAVESGKYGDNGREMLAEDPDMKKFTRNWNKTLKGLEADPVEAAKIQASVDNAYEQYDIPKVQVFVRKQTLEEKQTGENAHWDNGFVVISDDVMGELKYRSSVSPLGSDRKTTVKQSYPDLVSGLLVHELGHKYHDDNPHIMGNARTMVGTSQKEITTRISSYAATNPKELVAEAYAMSKHPDYSSLPKETRELINKVLHGVIK